MRYFLKAPGCLINVEHISSITLQPSGLLEIVTSNSKVFTIDMTIDEVLARIAKAYGG